MSDHTTHKRSRSNHVAGSVTANRPTPLAMGMLLSAVAAFAWSYWATIVHLYKEWQSNDDYSVGQLVPLVALYLVWRNRDALRSCRIAPCWWGIGLIALATGARAFGLMFLYESAERYALVLTIIGLVLLIAGWEITRKAGWVLLFLFLMVPLPGRVHNLISGPLQTIATRGSVFLLEVFAVTVIREGNTMLVDGRIPIAVVEACSGLRMLTAFVVVAATMTFLAKRATWQRAVLLLSSVPVAIACNVLRLFVTALLYIHTSSETAERFFHDFAGLTMMPIAVFILLGELWLLGKLAPSSLEPGAASQGPANRCRGAAPEANGLRRERLVVRSRPGRAVKLAKDLGQGK